MSTKKQYQKRPRFIFYFHNPYVTVRHREKWHIIYKSRSQSPENCFQNRTKKQKYTDSIQKSCPEILALPKTPRNEEVAVYIIVHILSN